METMIERVVPDAVLAQVTTSRGLSALPLFSRHLDVVKHSCVYNFYFVTKTAYSSHLWIPPDQIDLYRPYYESIFNPEPEVDDALLALNYKCKDSNSYIAIIKQQFGTGECSEVELLGTYIPRILEYYSKLEAEFNLDLRVYKDLIA